MPQSSTEINSENSMKSLVTYCSKSGNTRKLAEAIQAFLPGETILATVEEKTDTGGFDLVCVGFWFQSGKADPKSTEFLQNLDSPAPLFLFATHGAAAGSDHARNGMKSATELASPNTVIGTFSCQGKVNSGLLAKARTMEPPPPWIGDAPKAAGHPDQEDIRRLEKTLQDVVAKL